MLTIILSALGGAAAAAAAVRYSQRVRALIVRRAGGPGEE
jgi:pimeloyl-ACP methyl ester carboxylesterase